MSARIQRKREVKACIPCAKLKIKCEPGYPSEKCKRCIRLGKDCLSQTPGAHSSKRPREGKSPSAEVLRLEAVVKSVSRLLSTAAPTLRARPLPTPQASPISGSETDDPLPTHREAVELLHLFQSEMSTVFPFVIVPQHVAPSQLRLEKPLLYAAIMMSASQSDLGRQLRLAHILRQELCQAILINGEHSLAILQAVLVYVTWQHTHLQFSHELMTLVHLVLPLVTELKLDGNPHHPSRTAAGGLRDVDEDRVEAPQRTLEERRTFLGVLWVTSVTKACLKDIPSPKFTSYVNECCAALDEARESPKDAYLVQLVYAQKTLDRVSSILYADDKPPQMTPALSMAISTLETELQREELTLLANPLHASLLQLQHSTLQLHFYKIALDDRLFQPQSSYAILRTSLLFSCLNTIENLISRFISLPPLVVLCLPFANWGMVGHAMLILSRIAEVQNGSWDTIVVSDVLRHQALYKRFAEKLEEVKAAGCREMPPRRLPEIFDRMTEKLQDMGKAVEQRASSEDFVDGNMTFEDDFMNFDSLDWGQGLWGL